MAAPILRAALCFSLLLGSVLLVSVGTASAQADALTPPLGYGTPPPTADSRPPGALQVRVVGEPENVVLHHALGTCEMPCELTLSPDTHTFGVSIPNSDVIRSRPVEVDRPGLLRVEYLRRSGTRGTGWTFFTIAMPLAVLGGALGVVGLTSDNVGGVILGLLAAVAGGVNLIVALAAGIPLAVVPDGAQITFE